MDIFEFLLQHKDKFTGKRVLMAEDNEMNRAMVRDILNAQDFVVEEAADGIQAVDMVQSAVSRGEPGYYSCVLMDIQMPNMDGYDATRTIRSICSSGEHIPIIAITANNSYEDRQHCLEAGMDDFLPKPVDLGRLLASMARLM